MIFQLYPSYTKIRNCMLKQAPLFHTALAIESDQGGEDETAIASRANDREEGGRQNECISHRDVSMNAPIAIRGLVDLTTKALRPCVILPIQSQPWNIFVLAVIAKSILFNSNDNIVSTVVRNCVIFSPPIANFDPGRAHVHIHTL